MSHNCASHPLQCIVPPHMLESIKLRGSAKQRKMALAMEKQCDKVRGLRTSMATPGIAPVPSISGIRKPRVRREVYDGQHKASLPGVLVRDEKTGASGDKQVDQAFVGSGHVYNLYSTIYARDSLDGNGMTLISTVHHRRNYNNAFWDGKQMAYGDGDGELFQPLTNSLSVIGHEFAHVP